MSFLVRIADASKRLHKRRNHSVHLYKCVYNRGAGRSWLHEITFILWYNTIQVIDTTIYYCLLSMIVHVYRVILINILYNIVVASRVAHSCGLTRVVFGKNNNVRLLYDLYVSLPTPNVCVTCIIIVIITKTCAFISQALHQ